MSQPPESIHSKRDQNLGESDTVLGEKQTLPKSLVPGNRESIVDYYFNEDVNSEPYLCRFKVYVRLNAKKIRFSKVSFQHSIFENCYLYNCVFDTCDFTGCKFVGCNLHQSSFPGSKFDYAVFERSHIDDDILDLEAPREENLKMRFSRSLRMNYQQIGDAKAANKAILRELESTVVHLKKSWSSSEKYYREKYPGWKKAPQFFKWLEFCILDFVWGNGESTLKLLRTILIVHLLIAISDTYFFGTWWDLRSYFSSFKASFGIFFGINYPESYPTIASAFISALRLLSLAFLTAILIKRFGRR